LNRDTQSIEYMSHVRLIGSTVDFYVNHAK
jgi:hypothetical protein